MSRRRTAPIRAAISVLWREPDRKVRVGTLTVFSGGPSTPRDPMLPSLCRSAPKPEGPAEPEIPGEFADLFAPSPTGKASPRAPDLSRSFSWTRDASGRPSGSLARQSRMSASSPAPIEAPLSRGGSGVLRICWLATSIGAPVKGGPPVAAW